MTKRAREIRLSFPNGMHTYIRAIFDRMESGTTSTYKVPLATKLNFQRKLLIPDRAKAATAKSNSGLAKTTTVIIPISLLSVVIESPHL